jgi:hypothetical protein
MQPSLDLFEWKLLGFAGSFKDSYIFMKGISPVSALHQALSKLDFMVDKLEDSLSGLEQSMAGQQRDMFGQPLASNQNKTRVDRAEVARRLDKAIGKVETLLVEGGARGRG